MRRGILDLRFYNTLIRSSSPTMNPFSCRASSQPVFKLILFLLAIILSLNIVNAVGSVKSVEYVELFLENGTTTNTTALTKSQNTSHCVPFATQMGTGADDFAYYYLADIYFEGGTNITATRPNSTGNITLGIFIVEFDPNVVKVQQGEISFTGTTDTDTITSVNQSRAAMTFYFKNPNSSSTFDHSTVMGWFSADDTLSWQRQANDGEIEGHYYVFEAIGSEFSVQNISFSMAGGTNNTNISINTVVMNKTFLIASYYTQIGDDDCNDGNIEVYLYNSTLIKVERYDDQSPIDGINVFVISFSGDEYVQRGNWSYAQFDTNKNASITEVNTSFAMAWNVITSRPGVMPLKKITGSDMDRGFQKLKLYNSTMVKAERDENDGNAKGRWEVIEWIESGGWADTDFDRCKNITITNSGSETLTDFPAYINLTYDNDMQADFDDIRFHNAPCNNGGTGLDYEIENYTTSTRAHIWARIPSLPGAGTTISVYYKNNTGVGSGENPTGVWDSNYMGVWHMTEVNATDSTSNENNGTENGDVTFNPSGRIDGADDFNGSNYINIADDNSLDIPFNGSITVEAWINSPSAGAEDMMIYSMIDGSWNPRGMLKVDFDTGGKAEWYIVEASPKSGNYSFGPWDDELTSTTTVTDGNWYYVVGTYNFSELNENGALYINGVSEASGSSEGNFGPANLIVNQPRRIAYSAVTEVYGSYFNGTIDEVRVSNTSRSANWINMTYYMIANHSDYVSYGDEEEQPTEGDTTAPVVNINTSLNNTVTTSNTPSVDFNFTDSRSGTANCTLYFDSTAYNYTTDINNNTQTTLTVNTSLSDGNYSVNISCTDNSSNTGNSDVLNIEIDTTAPAITSVVNWSINITSAKVNWTTDEEANGSVSYGTTTALGDGTSTHSDFITAHNVSLSGLSVNTVYYYNVTSCDASGNCNISGPYSFTTSEGSSCTAPASGDWSVNCSHNCDWATDQDVPANLTTNDSGHVKLSANFTFTSTSQYITINSGCTFEVKSGGEIRKGAAAEEETDWANTSFDRCMNITITNSGAETLTNFPAYINLTHDNDMQADFTDIRFYNASCKNGGTALDYEIENYTASTRAHIWVRIPSLTSSGTTISVYYKNNTGVGSGENPTGVWDSNYLMVQHMIDLNTTAINDSTSTGIIGTKEVANNPDEVEGKIAQAQDFDATAEYIDLSQDDIFNWTPVDENRTFSVWFYPKAAPQVNNDYFSFLLGMNSGTATNHFSYTWYLYDGTNYSMCAIWESDFGGFAGYFYSEWSPALNQWYKLDFVASTAGNNEIYIDGVSQSATNVSWDDNTQIDPDVRQIGEDYEDHVALGYVDELRWSDNVRSADWINMSYQIVANQDSFVSFDDEELRVGWANDSFDRCMNITITNGGSETLTNFPAYINLTHDSDMLSDFKDIRFYDEACSEGGTELDYEIENYTSSTRAHIWARIPSLTSSGKTISIYYNNNTGVGSGENPSGVWDRFYKAVYHMTEINVTDSTSNQNNGTESGGVTHKPDKRIDGTNQFDGSNDFINISDSTSLDINVTLTISAWIYKNSTRAGDYDGIVGKGNEDGVDVWAYTITAFDDELDFLIHSDGDYRESLTNAANLQTHTWYYVAVTYNDSANNVSFYINGQYEGLGADAASGFSIEHNNYPLVIGDIYGWPGHDYNGTIDEVRVSNTSRSANWINQSYLMMNNQSDFVSFDDEELRTPWADSKLDRCMNITITNSGGETLTNFPAYINLTHDNDMQADFDDIRFYNESCNNSGIALDYEIENYTYSTRAHVWVKIPSLTSSGITISVYYDNNSGISNGEDPSGVWSNNYSAVWHMSEVNATDSTGAGNNGTEIGGVSQITGKIDGANDFDTTNFINVTGYNIPNETGQRTVMGWVKLNDKFSNDTARLIMRNTDLSGGDKGISWVYRNDNFIAYVINGTAYRCTDTMLSSPADDTWYHITMVHDNTNLYYYINGTHVDTQLCEGSKKNTNGLRFATYNEDSGGRKFNGTLDEFRISNVTRSANWINQSYLLMYNQSGYVSTSNEVAK